MNVKGIQPFHLLSYMTGTGCRLLSHQLSIGNFSTQGGQGKTHTQPIPYHCVQQEGNGTRDGNSKSNRIRHSSNDQKDALQEQKGGIVTRPMIFGLFAIIGCFVYHLGTRTQERLHLVQRRLHVHLAQIGQAAPILPSTEREGGSGGPGFAWKGRRRFGARGHGQAIGIFARMSDSIHFGKERRSVFLGSLFDVCFSVVVVN
mmetsp:Transcript_32202/g.67124  ORF Transcript_32202/g.67124 Transcript_32202/m.67124 type:complete len:202 (+) Transcript_32202:408-1013(+)